MKHLNFSHSAQYMKAACLVLMVMVFACAASTQSQPAQSPQPSVDFEAVAKDAKAEQLLKEAISKAKASDSKEINLFLDEEKGKVQEGDYVRVTYSAFLENGEQIQLLPPFASLNPEDYKVAKGEFTGEPKKFNRTLLAGSVQDPMGLGSAVMDMRPGQSIRVTLPPEKTYGKQADSKVRTIPRARRLPIGVKLSPDDYYRRFKAFPMKGAKVQFNPYVQAEVVEILEKEVALRLLPEHGRRFEEAYGYTETTVDPDSGDVVITLYPELGGYIINGTIVAVDDDTFTLDLNHPLSGKMIVVDITIEEIIKPSQFGNDHIQWIEDMDAAKEQARSEEKPIMLMLYADWCKWCKQMFGTTFEDPWVRYFKDAYVWVKINSDKKKEYMKAFGQKGFPMTVLLSSEGDIIRRLSGYKDALALRTELLEGLNYVRQDRSVEHQSSVTGKARSTIAATATR